MQSIQAYLKKRGITGLWEINPKPDKKFHQAVVIPAYGEAKLLPHTLTSMDKNDALILNAEIPQQQPVLYWYQNMLGLFQYSFYLQLYLHRYKK